MPIDWFDASTAIEFGESLAQFFIERVPHDHKFKKGKAGGKQLAKQFAVIDKMYLQIAQFKSHNKLNIYKKAKFGSAFKYKLVSAGFTAEFANSIAKGLLQKM